MSGPELSVIERVEKLLAKAESSEFEAERDAFTTKAQEMMTEHAISEAMLRNGADATDMVIRKLDVDMSNLTYAISRGGMLRKIAEANNGFVIGIPKGGGKAGYIRMEVWGTPFALECIETLWNSLNSQLDRELANTQVPSYEHGKTFRNNFIIGFADRVGYRLRAARDETVRNDTRAGTSLVLVNQAEKVEGHARDQYNNLRSTTRYVNDSGSGRSMGSEAGSRASLSRGALN